ncbi:hypothetical protein FHX42_001657 [Saccharopolyspora lacisalsi]|uniref:Uncharacterized protein n=1 Tax=Halosaccharopolyspora lacisalsi TaxID=1000566 RepID=A0A839DTR2_9PSEU|nr:hypothetical protein [Halosaccharopolyspora lacisalsi]MBA8824310.1 hypothetical protein [Halosaccharopolyspora lacisalsi]
MVWAALSGLTAVGALALVLSDHSMMASAAPLVIVLFSLFSSRQAKLRRQRGFRARFHSVEQIRDTHDLSRFHRLRDEVGEVTATRESRKEFPGISLVDAVTLVRNRSRESP